jgi:hypothetical protein
VKKVDKQLTKAKSDENDDDELAKSRRISLLIIDDGGEVCRRRFLGQYRRQSYTAEYAASSADSANASVGDFGITP